MVGEDAPGNTKLLVADLLIGDELTSHGNLLTILLVHKLPVLHLAGLTAVLDHLALLALPQGGRILRLLPVEHLAVETFVQHTKFCLPKVFSRQVSVSDQTR